MVRAAKVMAIKVIMGELKMLETSYPYPHTIPLHTLPHTYILPEDKV